MTLTITCDTCGRSDTAAAEAICQADHEADVTSAPEVTIVSRPSGGISWQPRFVDGRHGHECSICATDRQRTLNRQLDQISDKHRKALEAERAAAVKAWEQSRRPTEVTP